MLKSFVCAAALGLAASAIAMSQAPADLLIRNARVVHGDGRVTPRAPSATPGQAAHAVGRGRGSDGKRYRCPAAQGFRTEYSPAITGVGTPAASPRRTTDPGSDSTSMRLPCCRSMSSDDRVPGGSAST